MHLAGVTKVLAGFGGPSASALASAAASADFCGLTNCSGCGRNGLKEYSRDLNTDHSKTGIIETQTIWHPIFEGSGFQIQWGSEIRPSLDFEWSKTGWVANGLDFEWDLKSGSPTI